MKMNLSSSETEREVEEEYNIANSWLPTWPSSSSIGGQVTKNKKRLSKQMSMKETTREAAWEKRQRQIMMRRRAMETILPQQVKQQNDESSGERPRNLTDEDLEELKGFIDLGFKFKEVEVGPDLSNTLPALNFYFAVNRQFSNPKPVSSLIISPISTPTTNTGTLTSSVAGSPSPMSPKKQAAPEPWNMLTPEDTPHNVKTKLRHWAQAVACSVRQRQQTS